LYFNIYTNVLYSQNFGELNAIDTRSLTIKISAVMTSAGAQKPADPATTNRTDFLVLLN
jgi:hypothetical protein